MTQATATAWQQDCFATTPSLNYFATSLAALASDSTTPQQVLENAIMAMGINKDDLLREQAERCGFSNRTDDFEQTLMAVIHKQFLDLKSCHLTAAQRAQRRLIASL